MPDAFFVVVFAVAFFAAGACDYLETRYVRAVQAGAANRAALCSIAMMLVGSLCVYALVEVSPWVLLPESAGMYIGTRLAMR